MFLRYSYSLGLILPLLASDTPVLALDVLRAYILRCWRQCPTPLYLTYFGKALGRRKGGTFPLAVCENKRAEIDGILVGRGNIFLSGSTSAALGKCNVTLFWVKPHYRKRRHTKKTSRFGLTKGAGQCFKFWKCICGKATGRARSPSRPVT